VGEDLKHTSPKKGDTEDVVVIGSSAAGLYTAARVARGGRRVSVLESKATPDPAPRTLIVTDYFKNQISSAARSSILNEIRRLNCSPTDAPRKFPQAARPDHRAVAIDPLAGRGSRPRRPQNSATTRGFGISRRTPRASTSRSTRAAT